MVPAKKLLSCAPGYVVDTYKVWYRNGEEFKREYFLYIHLQSISKKQ